MGQRWPQPRPRPRPPCPRPWAGAIARAAFATSAALVFAHPIAARTHATRELTTDRPDTTESPFTVDARHIQFETTVFGYARGARDTVGLSPETVEVATTNLRIGLTPRLEVDVVLHPYGQSRSGGVRSAGLGALDLRAKVNVWGNDGGKTAFAVLPYVSIPLDRGNGIGPADTEYGVLLPLSIDLDETLSLGLNTGLNLRRADAGVPYRVSVPVTASLAVAWNDRFGSYYEIAAETFGGASAAISLNTGVTWLADRDLQFDAGVNVGVQGEADRIAPFVGATARF